PLSLVPITYHLSPNTFPSYDWHCARSRAPLHGSHGLSEQPDSPLDVPLVHAGDRQAHVGAILAPGIEVAARRDANAPRGGGLRDAAPRDRAGQPQPEEGIAGLSAPP